MEIYQSIYPVLSGEYEYLFNFSISCFKSNQYRRAITLLNEAKRYSNEYDLHVALGLNYMMDSDYVKSKAELQFAHNYIPHRLYPVYLLMEDNEYIGDTVEADRYAQNLIALRPKIANPINIEFKNAAIRLLQKNTK